MARTRQARAAAVADIPLAFEPGRFFSYSNTGYVLLGMIIERACGMTFDLVCPDGGINVPLFISDLDPAATDAPAVHIDPGYASRLFLLDDGRGGTIVIDTNAHRSLGQPALVGAAMPVLLASRFTP